MAYQAIPPATGENCAADPWGDNAAAFVASKVSTLVNVVFRTKCTTIQAPATAGMLELERAAVSGTGADAALDAASNGGVILFSTGTTGGSFRIVRNTNGVAAAGLKSDFVANCQTAKYAVVTRVSMDAPTSGCELRLCQISGEVANGDHFLGVVGTGVAGGVSDTNWALKIGSAAAVDTGVALPAAGVYVTVALIFNGTNVSAWNVETGVQIGASQAQSTATTSPGHFVALATNSAAANKNCRMDDAMVITEPAA